MLVLSYMILQSYMVFQFYNTFPNLSSAQFPINIPGEYFCTTSQTLTAGKNSLENVVRAMYN